MRKQSILLSIFLSLSFGVVAQDYQTFTYFNNDSIQLDLDLFLPQQDPVNKTPLVIFVHGGGFKDGNRTGGHELAKHLIKENIACATISYTL